MRLLDLRLELAEPSLDHQLGHVRDDLPGDLADRLVADQLDDPPGDAIDVFFAEPQGRIAIGLLSQLSQGNR